MACEPPTPHTTPQPAPTDTQPHDAAAAASYPQTADPTTILTLLRTLGERHGMLVHTHLIPGRDGHTAPWPDHIHPAVIDAWHTRGITRPWEHQAQCLDATAQGHDVVMATGTGSGKSLAAWTPILSDLAHAEGTTRISHLRRRPTAIYLSPTKALAADQYAALQRLITGSNLNAQVTTADGDTPKETKDWARAHADIILTNPDFLHFVLLPSHERWGRLIASLKYIIIDELHHWRGVTGSHIALVIRRLLRLAHHAGAHPRVIMLSATVRDPQAVGEAMIGRGPIHTITHDTSPAADHHLLLWRPREITTPEHPPTTPPTTPSDTPPASPSDTPPASPSDTTLGATPTSTPPNTTLGALDDIPTLAAPPTRLSAATEASLLLSEIITAGGQALAFVRSRAAAEALAGQVRDKLSSAGNPLAGRVAAYRGGYLPEERRALEAALRNGDIRALATTSALEMGIDISGLDVTLTAGWPGTRASLWQQIGRAGRAGSTGVSVLIASDDPLDSYIVNNPDHITTPVESATIDPTNPWVLAPHLAAAAAETPLTTHDTTYFGNDLTHIVNHLTSQGLLRRRPARTAACSTQPPNTPPPRTNTTPHPTERAHPSQTESAYDAGTHAGSLDPAYEWRWDFTRPERPTDLTDLRGSGGDVQIVDADTGAIIGSVPDTDADAQVFPNAIYVHQGLTYHVLSLAPIGPNTTQRVAHVQRVSTQLRTRAKARTHVHIQHVDDQWTTPDGLITWHIGMVTVTSQVTDFDLLRLPGLEFLRNHELHLPERTLPTKAVWYTLNPHIFPRLNITPGDIAGTLHAAEHAAIGILPLIATCDRWDLGGMSYPDHEQTNAPTVFVYDAYRGGAGHARSGFDHVSEWMSMTRDTVTTCPCDSGCPSCIQSPKCGNGNEPLSKSGAHALLAFLSETAS